MSDDREALLALAERVEAGQIDDQRELLIQAWDMINRLPSRRERDGQFAEWLNFECMLDAGAFESAAIWLVPEVHNFALDTGALEGAAAWCFDKNLWNKDPSYAATPALALVSAALRAHAGAQP